MTARAAELEGNLTAATTTTTGVSNHALEQSTEDDGGQTEGTGGEAKGVPNGKAGVEGGWGEGKGDGSMVEEVDLAVLESLDRCLMIGVSLSFLAFSFRDSFFSGCIGFWVFYRTVVVWVLLFPAFAFVV